jgi:hypothetical protein
MGTMTNRADPQLILSMRQKPGLNAPTMGRIGLYRSTFWTCVAGLRRTWLGSGMPDICCIAEIISGRMAPAAIAA